MRIYLVDDGSSDGTADAVLREFPHVRVLRGDGNLWWGGATNLAMEQALADGAEGIIWLNDDFILRPGALEALWKAVRERGGVGGGVLHGHAGSLSGLARGANGPVHIPEPKDIVPCEALAGNFVCFSADTARKIGSFDAFSFPHILGDIDYTLRASGAGLPVFVVPAAAGDSADEEIGHRDSWFWGTHSIWTAWKVIPTMRCGINPRCRWIFLRRHWGGRGAVVFFKPYLTLCLATLFRMVRPWLPRALQKKPRRAPHSPPA